jgi:nicotinamide-nucleotide amidase
MSSLDAARVVATAAAKGITIAVAESLTGGSLCAALTAAPGASEVIRGGVVAYQADVKHKVLGVPSDILDAPGPVSEEVALAMADGARKVLGAELGIATTGVAGPEWHGGQPPGRVHIAAVSDGARLARRHDLAGDRDSVVDQSRALAMALLEDLMLLTPHSGRRGGEQV